MPKTPPTMLNFKNLKDYRKRKGLNQTEFWSRFGITQPTGCRYESERQIPTPPAMLLWLHAAGKIDDNDLAEALKNVTK